MSLYDIGLTTIDGQPQTMQTYRGKVLLIVNVASECGFTPQYQGLQTLHEKYQAQGFCVLGFPCDQFGHQEPKDEEDIWLFCSSTYQVSFPMFAKVKVNGSEAHPLFQYLKSEKKGILGTEAIKWNFTKFLVGADGSVLKRYAPADTPASIDADIKALLSPTP